MVSVLFCDLVGFTSRSERMDVEDVHGTLQPYHALLREQLERHGGTVEKFIGDAVMAVFGAPAAHEDDPERAVRAGLAIVEAVAELRDRDPSMDLHVRVGVNTGEALVALDADPKRGEGMASGDVVNTAARLEAAAPIDGILVGEVTYRATSRVIRYEQAAAVSAKGKADPVAAWQAVDARSRFGIDVEQGSRIDLVGRERELNTLRDAAERAFSERDVQLVTLIGVPGIGKSRLVWEFSRWVDEQPDLVRWRQGRCLPYGDGVTWWALGEVVKAEAGILESDDSTVAMEKVTEMVEAAVADPQATEWVRRHAATLVGASRGDGGSGDPAETFAAWRLLIESLATDGPMVVVFEDLQWADDAVLDFIDELAEWVTDAPLVMVCTARPELLERRRDWGGGKSNAATVALRPLSDDDTRELLGALLANTLLPAETQAALLERAQGNPLYAEEYVRMLADRGDTLSAALPETVQGIIAARLDALSVEEKLLLQDAAVIGKVAWLGAILALGESDRYASEERLHRLVRKEFLRRAQRSSVEGDTEYVFRHALVRDVAYQQIARAARAQKHVRAAEWLESLAPGRDESAEMRAHHYRQALEYARATGTATDELEVRARAALGEAAERAVNLGSLHSAVSLFEGALELTPTDDPARPMLLYGYCHAREFLGTLDLGLVAETVDQLEAAGELAAAAAIEVLRAFEYDDAGRGDLARESYRRAVELAEQAPDGREKARALSGIAGGLAVQGDRERAYTLGQAAAAVATACGDALAATRALNAMAISCSDAEPERISLLEQALAIAREGNVTTIDLVLWNLASGLEGVGRLVEARALGPEMRAAAERFGNQRMLLDYKQLECAWSLHAGGWSDAESQATALIESTQSQLERASVTALRCQLRIAVGNVEAALRDADRVGQFARDAGRDDLATMALTLRSTCLACLGQTELARQAIDAWCAKPHGESGEQVLAMSIAMWLAGETDRFARLPPPAAVTPWWEAATAIADGRLADAADVMQRIGSLFYESLLRSMWAEHLMSDGREDEAAPYLARSLDIYRSEKATRRVNQALSLSARFGAPAGPP